MTKAEIYKYEMNPELYLKRRRDIRNHRIGEILGGMGLLILGGLYFALVQILGGMW